MYQVIQDLNYFLRGWFSYFKIQEFLHTYSQEIENSRTTIRLLIKERYTWPVRTVQ